MLKITNLYKTFHPGTVNAKTALNGLNLELEEGDFVTVIGGNGAGKSTMLNAIAGVWKPDSGTIEINGIDVTSVPEYKRASYLGRAIITLGKIYFTRSVILAFRFHVNDCIIDKEQYHQQQQGKEKHIAFEKTHI